jgi:GT2 family glycosyltransferase
VVDNHSVDNSIKIIKQKYPEVHLIKLENNLGFSRGNNIGVSYAKGDFLVFLNNDTIVDRKWLVELIQPIDKFGEDAIFSSKVLFMDFPWKINTIGGMITPLGGGFDIGYGDSDCEKYGVIRQIGSPAGCSMLIKKSIFLELNGFDEDYFAYFEDVDLGWRCWLAGYGVYYIPTSVVYHKGGGTAGPLDTPFRIYHGQKNRLQNMTKNFTVPNLILGITFGIIFDSFKCLIFLFEKKGKLFNDILRGYAVFFIGINTTLKKRKMIQKHRLRTDSDLKEMKLIASFNYCISEYIRLQRQSETEAILQDHF